MMQLRTVTASRYVTPLREGGSLPAIIEADDDGLYVLKFRGAGQGPKALIAGLLAGPYFSECLNPLFIRDRWFSTNLDGPLESQRLAGPDVQGSGPRS